MKKIKVIHLSSLILHKQPDRDTPTTLSLSLDFTDSVCWVSLLLDGDIEFWISVSLSLFQNIFFPTYPSIQTPLDFLFVWLASVQFMAIGVDQSTWK